MASSVFGLGLLDFVRFAIPVATIPSLLSVTFLPSFQVILSAFHP
jgi:hypothetical protein